MQIQNDLESIIQYSKSLKVLYVEDTLEAREQALKLLENFFEDISVAINGQEGLDIFKNNKYDLVISDLNMPIMNGIDMIKNIRLLNKNIPIIIISAYNEQSFKDEASQYNIIDYLTKPVSLDKFLNSLKKIKES